MAAIQGSFGFQTEVEYLLAEPKLITVPELDRVVDLQVCAIYAFEVLDIDLVVFTRDGDVSS